MESNQKKWITKNIDELASTTLISQRLLNRLHGENYLNAEEVWDLRREDVEPIRKSFNLYQILMKRTGGAYEKLVEILEDDSQTAAAEILRGLNPRPTRSSVSFYEDENRMFQSLPANLQFLASSIAVLSPNCVLTMDRVMQNANPWMLKFIRLKDSNLSEEALESIKSEVEIGENIYMTELPVVTDSTQRRVYVVQHDEVECGRVKFKDGVKIFYDQISWGDLTDKYKRECQGKQLNFSGQNITLEELCEWFEASTGSNICKLLEHLEGTMLLKLLNNNIPAICSNSLMAPRRDYIPRLLKSRRHISRRILEITKENTKKSTEEEDGEVTPIAFDSIGNITNDILVFKNVELYDLQLLVKKYGHGKCDHSSNIINPIIKNPKQKQVTNILLQQQQDFEEICKMTNSPVHLFDCKKGAENTPVQEIHWVKSQGSLSSVHMYIHDVQEDVKESALTEEDITSPVIIADSDGTGKSTLMKKWASDMIKKGFCVQYIEMTEFLRQFFSGDATLNYDESDDNKLENFEACNLMWDHLAGTLKCFLKHRFVKAISQHASNSKFEQLLIRTIISSRNDKFKMGLFFDGLDEINPGQMQLAKLILGYFTSHELTNIRVWIATRPDLLEEFEENFGVLGYNLKPFNSNDPIFVLTSYWINSTQDELFQTRLKTFAAKCYQIADKNISEQEKLMVGKPLICRLLSYVYQEEALRIAGTKTNCEINVSDITSFTLTKMFKNYIEAKLDKGIAGLSMSYSKPKLYYYAHMVLGIKLLFPRLHSCFMEVFRPQTDALSQAILSIGIVEMWKKGAPPRFVHKTLADYFAAATVIELLLKLAETSNECNDKTVSNIIHPLLLLLSQIFKVDEHTSVISDLEELQNCKLSFRFRHYNICFFLNHLLDEVDCNILSRVSNVYVQLCRQVTTTTDEAKFMAAMKCWVMPLCYQTSSALPIGHITEKPSEFNEILYFAAKYGDMRMLQLICNFFQSFTNLNVIEIEDEEGEADIVFKSHTGNNDITLLHIAVESGDDEKVDYLITTCGYEDIIWEKRFSNLFELCLLNTNYCDSVAVKKRTSTLQMLASRRNGAYFAGNAHFRALSLMVSGVSLELLYTLLDIVFGQMNFSLADEDMYFNTSTTPHNFVCSNSHGQNIFHLLPTTHYDKKMNPEKYHEALEKLEAFFQYDILVPIEEEYPRKNISSEDYETDIDDQENETSENEEFFDSNTDSNFPYSEVLASNIELPYISDDRVSVYQNENEKEECTGIVNEESFRYYQNDNLVLQESCSDVDNLEDSPSPSYADNASAEREDSSRILVPEKENSFENNNPVNALKLYLESVNSAGWTPVHVAVSCLNLLDKTLEFFIRNGVSLDIPDHRGSTCIFKAVAGHRSKAFLRRLIAHGANVKHKKKMGEQLLHVAAAYYNFKAVKLLVNEFKQKVDVVDEDGNTPLHVIFRTHSRGIYHDQNMEVEIKPNNQHKIIQFLIENGADINKANRSGETALDLALRSIDGGDDNIFKILTNPAIQMPINKYFTLALKGIIMNSRFGSIWHPKLITPFAEELTKLGANVSQTDSDGATLLHLAAKAHSIGVVFLLERNLINVNTKDNRGQTALDYMSCKKDPDKCKIYNCGIIRSWLVKATTHVT
ncbi:unnamed protein product [Orchesella dallaii]|uniref:CARD domain-containing protein n=1 Tax=Orchesella dallaii TaxID=48710 RepID=A0ABP1PIM6_9HEXA